MLETATIVPAVNQVRLAPGVYQDQVVAYCREKGILLEAWGPFGQGELFDSKQVQEIAANHGKSVAQIALAWSLAEGFYHFQNLSQPLVFKLILIVLELN